MQLFIAGKDKSQDLGATLTQQAARLREIKFRVPEHSALSLKQVKDSTEYLEQFCMLMRLRHGVQTDSFSIPVRPGWAGHYIAKVKRFLWRLLRYQHDQLAFQQNVINELVITAVDFQQETVQMKLADLESRLAHVEASIGHASRKDSGAK